MFSVIEAVLVLKVTVDLGLDQGIRNRNLDQFHEFIDDLVASLRALTEALGAGYLILDVGLELLDGVELAGNLGEVVVGLRQFTLLDRE